MRVTFVLPGADLSGGVRVVATYGEALQRRGHEVLIVHPPAKGVSVRERISALRRGQMLGWRQDSSGSHLDGRAVGRKVLDRFREVQEEDISEADVLVATWWRTAEWIERMGAGKGAPMHLIQGDDREAYRCVPGMAEQVERVWRLPIPKVVVSEWVGERVREVNPGARVRVIENGVDMEQFNSPPRDKGRGFVVGFVYSVEPCKGTDLVLEAIARAGKQIQMQVVGFGPPPSASMRLPPQVRYEIHPRQDRLRQLYGACDAWLFGSRAEGFGLPILEAMACRTPVIAMRAGAARELMAGGGGVLVSDVEEMARAMVEFARMPGERWRGLSEAALMTAGRFTWSRAVTKFEAEMREVQSARANGRPQEAHAIGE